MALLHHATLTPSKPELIAAWLPGQPWATGLPPLTPVGGYRLDDPDGEVGMEGIVLRVGADADPGPDGGTGFVHVPLTYRGAPLDGADAHLIGTLEHSVLGTRWVYDAAGDPLFRAVLTRTILEGRTGAEEHFEVDGEQVARRPSVVVVGSGGTAAESTELVIVHLVDDTIDADDVLTGTWEGGSGVLAALTSAASR